jgi:hypothetical protein
LKLEIKDELDQSVKGAGIAITPPINETYWLCRVNLFKDQSILAFPKFFTIGIGFAQEEDWNTNLPYSCTAEEIADHIGHNRKYQEITDEQIIEAINLIKDYIEKSKKAKNN